MFFWFYPKTKQLVGPFHSSDAAWLWLEGKADQCYLLQATLPKDVK